MNYRIARNGDILGSYTLLEVQSHLASGHIVTTDLAQSDTMDEWLPVAELFPEAAMQGQVVGSTALPKLYPDPPDLPWWIALILGILTLGAFFVVWDVVEAAWLRRVERSYVALVLYSAALGLYVLNIPAQLAGVNHALFSAPPVEAPFALWLSLGGLLARLAARFVLRSNLLRHFNRIEPIGLRLNWFLTLLLGGLYFQYQFNCINAKKRSLRVSVPG